MQRTVPNRDLGWKSANAPGRADVCANPAAGGGNRQPGIGRGRINCGAGS